MSADKIDEYLIRENDEEEWIKMMMFSEQFLEHNSFELEYKGKIINAFYTFDRKGSFKFEFCFVSTESLYGQAIILHLDTFKGKLLIDGKEIKKEKGRFPQLIFDAEKTSKQFEVEVVLQEGDITICNGYSDPGLPGMWDSLYGGCAMIIEKIEDDYFRFHCNDFENDDDFNDLVFDLKIVKAS